MKNKIMFGILIMFMFITYLPKGFSPRIDNNNILEQSSILIVDTIAPSITAVFGANNSYYTANTIIFNFTATDTGNSGVRSGTADLYANFSGTQKLNQSMMNWNTSVRQGFNTTTAIPDGHYVVWMLVNDTAGNFANTTNITIQVDGNVPIVQFNTTQFNNDSIINSRSLRINVTINETFFRNATFSLHNGTNKALAINYTFNDYTPNVTFSMLADGNYSYNVTVFDQGNLSASTDTRNITIDATSPSIILSSPPNNTEKAVTLLTDLIEFRFSVNENSSLCNVFFDNSKRTNSTSSLDATTIFASPTGFGIGQWFVNCTDYANNTGQSPFFNLNVVQAGSSGGGPVASPPGGASGGGGGGLQQPSSQSFTKDYICSKIKTFVNAHIKNGKYQSYSYNELDALQTEVLKETGYDISKISLAEYIDGSESYCNVSKTQKVSILPKNATPGVEFLSIADIKNFTMENQLLNLTFQSYLPIFGDGLNVGFLKDNGDPNSKGLLTITTLFFKVKPSDKYSSEPNFVILGPRIFPLALITLSGWGIYKYRKLKKRKKDATPSPA